MNGGERTMPCASSVVYHVERNACKFPQRTALFDEEGRLTYAEPDARCVPVHYRLTSEDIANSIADATCKRVIATAAFKDSQ